MALRMKVFCWSDGLHAYTVAATSRAKALAAWGFKRDLFREGLAREISGGPDHDRALASPGDTVQRDLTAAGAKVRTVKPPKRDAAASRRRRAARERLEALERDVAALDEDAEASEATLARERERLEQRANRTRGDVARRRATLRAKLKAARADLGR
jgi:hypothetical protein